MIESYKKHLIEKIEHEYISKIRLDLELGLETIKEDTLDIFQSHVTLHKIDKHAFYAACTCPGEFNRCAGRFIQITWEEYDSILNKK